MAEKDEVRKSPKLLYTLKDVCVLVGKSYRAIVKDHQRGILQTCRDARTVRVSKSQLLAYLERFGERENESNQDNGAQTHV